MNPAPATIALDGSCPQGTSWRTRRTTHRGRAAGRRPWLFRPQLDRRVAPAEHARSPGRQPLQQREVGRLTLDSTHQRGAGHDAHPELAREGLQPAGDVGRVAHGRERHAAAAANVAGHHRAVVETQPHAQGA